MTSKTLVHVAEDVDETALSYAENCDGMWEHMYGVEIETLDNPGWHVKIDLKDTKYENMFRGEVENDNGDVDWIRCTINDTEFQGFGDIHKLKNIIEMFKDWVVSS